MSYAKPIKQCQDNAIGFRTVNELAASQDAQKTLFDLEHVILADDPNISLPHGDLGGGGAGIVSLQLNGGEHDTPKIARGSMGVTIVTAGAPGAPVANARYRSGICLTFQRIATGEYFFPLPVDVTAFYAEAHPLSADNTTYRRCEVIPSDSFTTPIAIGVYVSTYQQAALSGGALGLTLADFSFDLVVYANRGTNLDDSLPFDAAVATAPPWLTRRRWTPKSAVFKPV